MARLTTSAEKQIAAHAIVNGYAVVAHLVTTA